MPDSERPVEADEEDAESSSSDEDLEEDAIPEIDEDQESSDEAEVGPPSCLHEVRPINPFNPSKASGPNLEANDDSDSESEDEQIVVTRQEEERDPVTEAEFDREFEKMMAESMDSRRFERKTVFDIPLPMKRLRENMPENMPTSPEPAPVEPVAPKTMAFSLMTKKGNKQQVALFIHIRTIIHIANHI